MDNNLAAIRDASMLVVDRSRFTRSLTRSLLTSCGFANITTIASADEALKSLRADHFDAVLCGEQTEGAEPLEFLHALRRDLATQNITIPVLLLSAQASFPALIGARDAGINGVLARPMSAKTLRDRLEAQLLRPKRFVTTWDFIGPDRRSGEDRRRFKRPYGGEERRTTDLAVDAGTRFSVASAAEVVSAL